MTHKEQILKTIEIEITILNHLHTKIPAGKMDFKPAEGTRTMYELLRYITWASQAPLKTFIDGDEDSTNFEIYKELSEGSKNFKSEEFPEAMNRQLSAIKELFEKFSDEDLLKRKVMMPYQEKVLLGEAIINTVLKHLTAYRMQLYIYLKILGVNLNTVNCWLGEDATED